MNRSHRKTRTFMMIGGGALLLALAMVPAADHQSAGLATGLGVMALLVLGAFWLRKRKDLAQQTEPCMQVIERLTLEQGRTLHLVDVDGQRLLLASQQSGIGLISVFGREGNESPDGKVQQTP